MTNPKLLSFLFISLVVSSCSWIAICNADGDEHQKFGYKEGASDGPKNWGALSADWKTCATGKLQSPIDIDTKVAEVRPSDLKKAYKEAPAKLFDLDHAIAVEWEGDAGGIEMNGTTYKLVQCHWHIPSEHTFNGKRYDVEIHCVHSNAKDELAVLGYLYSSGPPDPFIGKIKEKIKEVDSSGKVGIDLGEMSGSSVSWGSKKYFRYFGSLTTPPCKENVIWTVADMVGSVSKDQIKLLEGALQLAYQENARPVQELGGRSVWQFDSPEEKEGAGEETEKSGSTGLESSWPRNGIMFLILLCFFYLF